MAETERKLPFALEAQHKITVDKRKITLSDPIKTFGTYILDVKLYADITGKITVSVTEN